MPTATVFDPVDILGDLGNTLIRFSENRDAVLELREAFEQDDPARFADVFSRMGFEPPGDICDPYVTILILVVTYRWVRECKWVFVPGKPKFPQEETGQTEEEQMQDFVNTSALPFDPQKWFDQLQKLGYFRCTWRLERDWEFVKIDRFVQGMCPPGTF